MTHKIFIDFAMISKKKNSFELFHTQMLPDVFHYSASLSLNKCLSATKRKKCLKGTKYEMLQKKKVR